MGKMYCISQKIQNDMEMPLYSAASNLTRIQVAIEVDVCDCEKIGDVVCVEKSNDWGSDWTIEDIANALCDNGVEYESITEDEKFIYAK